VTWWGSGGRDDEPPGVKERIAVQKRQGQTMGCPASLIGGGTGGRDDGTGGRDDGAGGRGDGTGGRDDGC